MPPCCSHNKSNNCCHSLPLRDVIVVAAVVVVELEGIVEAVLLVQLVVIKLVNADQKVDHVDNNDNDVNKE